MNSRRLILLFCIGLFAPALPAIARAALPSVHGKDLFKGSELTITAEKSKALVVVFLSAKCPCSDSHLTELISLSKEHPDFRFVAVHSNPEESPEETKAYFEKAKLPFALIQDEKTKIADEFKALKTPHVFVVRPDGTMAYQGGVSSSKQFERADRKLLREALDDLAHDREVKTPEGRTLGCVISREEKFVW